MPLIEYIRNGLNASEMVCELVQDIKDNEEVFKMIDFAFVEIGKITIGRNEDPNNLNVLCKLLQFLCSLCRDKSYRFIPNNQKKIIGGILKSKNIVAEFFSQKFYQEFRKSCIEDTRPGAPFNLTPYYNVFLQVLTLIADCSENYVTGALHAQKVVPDHYGEFVDTPKTPFV